MNFYPRYVGDYGRDTGDLTFEEDAAYNRLLDWYYANERPLDASLDRLYLIARARKASELAAVRIVAARFFPLHKDGSRHNKRADEEIRKARKRIKAAATNGKKGGRKPSKNPAGSRSQTQRDYSPSPSFPTEREMGGKSRGLAPISTTVRDLVGTPPTDEQRAEFERVKASLRLA
jgi:uncharacterized protein YdaU (DUF1376 family)